MADGKFDGKFDEKEWFKLLSDEERAEVLKLQIKEAHETNRFKITQAEQTKAYLR